MKNIMLQPNKPRTNTLFFAFIFLLFAKEINAQLYVPASGETTFYSAPHLDSSTNWSTDRSATPGHFNWLIASGDYTGVDDNHNINGYVQKYGPEAFTFPVGDGTQLRELTISAPASPSEIYSVAWITGDPSTNGDPSNNYQKHKTTAVSGNIVAVSTLGQWDWQAVNGSGDGLIITVSIPAMNEAEFNDASKLRLVGWNGTSWESMGTKGATGITNNSRLSGTMKAGIQAIGIGTVSKTVLDTDLDSVPDTTEGQTADTDADGILDYLDTDDDNDGVLTMFEIENKTGKGTVVYLDTDQDGIPNYLDADDDGDSVLTKDEKPDLNGDGNPDDAWDLDEDGKPNYLDNDDNGDGILSQLQLEDLNHNGTLDYLDIIDSNAELVIYNGVSPNNDGKNDSFEIKNIELYPDNTVEIYDRWGRVVYETKGYNQHNNEFIGKAEGETKYEQGKDLENDTYFFVIKYKTDNGVEKSKTGYLYLNR
jgi:gliding motility-associated-like protein